MKNSLSTGFIAGSIGAVLLVIIMYVMKATGLGADPAFVSMYRGMFGENPPVDQVIAAILFIISGGIWGAVFTALVKNPTLLKGFLFGILPTLWLWIVVNATLGKPLFNDFTVKGLLMPIVFNMVIWGTFVGWYTANKLVHRNTYSTT